MTAVVRRVNSASGAASVLYSTANGTAVAGRDYIAVSGTLSWPDGDFSDKKIVIPVIKRVGQQASRSFTVNLSAPSGAALGSPSSATVTTLDVPPGPTIMANGATGNVLINYPNPVTVNVEMNADIYAGTPVDWWVVAYDYSGDWYSGHSPFLRGKNA